MMFLHEYRINIHTENTDTVPMYDKIPEHVRMPIATRQQSKIEKLLFEKYQSP